MQMSASAFSAIAIRSLVGSTVAPATTRTRRSCISFGPRRRITRATIASTSAIFAFSSSRFGSMISTASSLSRRRFVTTVGFSIMDSCAAGATRIGIPEPRAFVAYVVTVESSIPFAILPTVLAVQGAMRRRSALPSRPHIWRYSMAPVISVTTGRPVAYSSAFGWRMAVAERVMTAWTSAPWRMSSWESRTLSTAAMLPVTPRTMVLPWSLMDRMPRNRSAGCIPRESSSPGLKPMVLGLNPFRARLRQPLTRSARLRGAPMDYQTTLEHLYRLERFGIKLGLENVRQLLSLLGDPHRGLRAVHVTGTNGKGSVCAYVAAALRATGYRVGLYTSPHLIRFNERIRVDGEPIADDDVLRLWSGMQPAIHAMTAHRAVDHPTFFEVTTAMAFQYFRERGVDIAVLEVGMGGRMDATNVVDGLVSVVTRVDLEHTEHLGKTVDRIAREKAGIIKPSSRAVTVTQEALPVIEARCREVHAPLSVLGRDVRAERTSFDLRGQEVRIRGPFGEIDVRTPLLGAFQVEHVAVAVAALTELL